MNLRSLYVWSVVMEPMLYFVIGHPSYNVLTVSLGRVLQLTFLFCFACDLLVGKTHRFPSLSDFRFKWLWLFFSIAVVSGLIGFLTGAYDTGIQTVSSDEKRSLLSQMINNGSVRPFVEYLIVLYDFVYFIVLPSVIFKSENDFRYFFKVFFFIFNSCVVVGLLAMFLSPWYDFMGRTLFDDLTAGFRFHGFAGEPRDAFVLMGFGAAMYHLRCQVLAKKQRTSYYLLILACAFLTSSLSGLIGVAIFVVLAFVFVGLSSLRNFLAVLLIIGLSIVATWAGFTYTDHLKEYKQYLTWEELDTFYSTGELSKGNYTLTGQLNNFYPLLWSARSLIEDRNPFPVLIGGGLGSAAAANSRSGIYGSETVNPHANIVRILCETGVIGFVFFLVMFIVPVSKMARRMPFGTRYAYILFILLMLGLQLGHKSKSLYIYLGIFAACHRVVGLGEVRRRTDGDSSFSVVPASPVLKAE